jgi:hypothetical protein
MKKNSIKFKLETDNERIIEITAEVQQDNTLTRMGKPVCCNCSGNTLDTATPFIYHDGFVECPNCGKSSTEITTFSDYEDNELENLHLKYFGTDYITMQKLYKLSYTVPYESWCAVEDCFMKLTPDDVDLGSFEPYFVGWVTSNPEEVEERLGIKKELRVNYYEQQKIIEDEKEQEKQAELQLLLSEILEEFSLVETPESSSGMFELEGTIVDNPFNPWNEYGGGEYFVINSEYIWYVRNNSRDTDNHDFNNIHIKGSYGAIGKRIVYDKSLEDKIKRLRNY